MPKSTTMKTILRLLFSILLLLSLNITYAQKKPYYTEQEQVVEAARNALNNAVESGDFKEWAIKNNMKGSFIFNLTIGGTKGEVYTINALERTGEVKQQNTLKDYVKSMRFPFKMPKNRSYQFEYEFNF
jgi:hypothetical protein